MPGPLILAITNSWPPMPAGTGVAFRHWLQGLEDLIVLAPKQASDEPHVRRVFRFAGWSGGPFKIFTLLQHFEILWRPIAWCLRNGRPQTTISSQALFSGLAALHIRSLFGSPYIVFCHGEEFTSQSHRSGIRAFLKRRVLTKASVLVCNSKYTSDLARATGIDAAKLMIAYPSIDAQELGIARPSSPDIPSILMVGRLEQKHKGFDRAIEAMPQVLREVPQARLIIAGPGDDSELIQLAGDKGVESHVDFLGPISRTELLTQFASCSLFLMPGRTVNGAAEGFGIVFLEAGFFGKPSIGGQAGGSREAVIDGITGILVDGNSLFEIENAILRLLQDDNLREKMGANARSRIIEDFSGASSRAVVREAIERALTEV